MFRSAMLSWSQAVRHHRRLSSSYIRYEDLLSFRRTQAARSVLVQVSALESTLELKSYLSLKFGPVTSVFHYTLPSTSRRIVSAEPTGPAQHWVIAEFESRKSLESCLETCRYAEDAIPFRSSMCWFSKELSSKKTAGRRNINLEGLRSIQSEMLGEKPPALDFDRDKTITKQMLALQKSREVTEISTRVRFLVCHHLEDSLKSLFPTGCILPFGSSVCGIGSNSGDLDLVLLPQKLEIFSAMYVNQDSRIWFQSKLNGCKGGTGARFQGQRVMETVADILTLFFPGCKNVVRILQARVPILRFMSEYSGIMCDLSMTNATGVHMSELIYMMSWIDKRFQPLNYTVRAWAACNKLTNPAPGKWITNFSLAMLLISFLQHKRILPTWDILFNNARPEDKRITSDGVDCTFLRDATRIQKFFTPQNGDVSLSELLFEFFEYYGDFDFSTKGISLITGSHWSKPDTAPLYIQNPLERHLNVCRNVSKEEVARFKNECCSALWKLESSISSGESLSLTDLLTLTPAHKKSRKGQPLNRIPLKEILKD